MEFIRKIQTKSVIAKRRDHEALGRVAEGVADALVHEADHDLDDGLELSGYAGGRVLGDAAEQGDEDESEQDREHHRVDVDREEITLAFVPDPLPVRLADGQILEMVGDVLAG